MDHLDYILNQSIHYLKSSSIVIDLLSLNRLHSSLKLKEYSILYYYIYE
jgi:hypothetical protein